MNDKLGAGISRLDEDQVALGRASTNQQLTVTLWHVDNRRADVADLRITNVERPDLFESMEDKKKWENSNCWTVTYTPYCGGRHKIYNQGRNHFYT